MAPIPGKQPKHLEKIHYGEQLMEHQETYLHRPTTPKSTAIDLTGSPAGILASAPTSPSLGPSNSSGSFSRRRTSWGQRLDVGQDPLQLDPFQETPSAALSSSASGAQPTYPVGDDLFSSPTDDRSFPFSARYGSQNKNMNPYSSSQPGLSSASLFSPRESDSEVEDGHREDDEAHLTSNMSLNGTDQDPERSAALTPRSRRTLRYSPSASPLKKTGTAIKSMSQNLRRASVRVVNLASAGLENQMRLAEGVEDEEEPLPDLSKTLPIRGRTLGFLGTDSKVRLALFNFLVYPWTEPTILVLIILNAVVLTIQAALPLTLSTSDGTAVPPRIKGYFHSWEDYALFVLFIIFTLEAFARICVSGFLFDPDVSMGSLFYSPFRGKSDRFPLTASVTHNTSLGRSGSLSQAALNRGTSVSKRLHNLKTTLLRPFTLNAHAPTSPYPHAPPDSEVTLTQAAPPPNPFAEKILNAAHDLHHIVREPQTATFLSRALKSDNPDVISLPFSLSVTNAHDKAIRNIPYLRQSWSRIDFIAIVSFWIAFALAMSGVERGRYHLGIFRAMSVIRTARLLTITSGTTTIMHSLKTARPLLTRVAYFVLFAMVLFSIIGVQSFKGSFRRTCMLQPVLGEQAIPIAQFCGGHIDPVTLRPENQENPSNNVESFDALWYSALQVIITASANGVRLDLVLLGFRPNLYMQWTPLMYSMIDAEYFFSCFFFIVCIIVLNFWLINLFVAVITNTFSAIRSETKKSAFGAAPLVAIPDGKDDGWAADDTHKATRPNLAKAIYEYTRWCWVLLALASLALQATRSVDMDETHELVMYYGELGITRFLSSIILRPIRGSRFSSL
ncbi:hypothetical protein C0991_001251 [Blastosporella zonata]|nr:hypothetical protein C0991_001251 [Blastosporella zonata]